eukprot:TRINITY_DN20245_c0_g2_i1.p1 TRINITY_DN20245_c0_g2~~TRINITY_DN20245_c0_g2_i1.p1  ORF type:complete len:407 (+),score=57.24 TRINITY_DN20245_c0_g2_i1:46-1221(+)
MTSEPDARQPDIAGLLFLLRRHVESQQDFLEKQLALQREHLQEQLCFIDEQMALAPTEKAPQIPGRGKVFLEILDDEILENPDRALDIDVKTASSNPKFFTQTQAAKGAVSLPKTTEETELKGKKSPDMKTTKAELDDWVRCNGLHTVDEWLSNYRKHPAGWAGLLMIHGIPEVSARLRLKVQNFAIFAALFLGGSIKTLTSRPHLESRISMRIFTYSFCIGIAAHMLCIMLGMTFHNALSECARDSDVFRMFARGKGYRATAWCERSFYIGALACCVGILANLEESLGWEVLPVSVLSALIVMCISRHTHNLLFSAGSIVKYWREEKGGKPDPGDPYDLSIPLAYVKARAGHELLHVTGDVLDQQDPPKTPFDSGLTDDAVAPTIIGAAD